MERSGNFYKAIRLGYILISILIVKRANHNKGSMIVSDPTELVQPGGNNHSSRFVRLCVGACFIHGAG